MAAQGLHTPSSVKKVSIFRGHPMYKVVLTPVIGEELPQRAEGNNKHNDYSADTVKDSDVTGSEILQFTYLWGSLDIPVMGGNITHCIMESKVKVADMFIAA